MKKHLFLHLSFMGLMGLSTIVYGGSTPSYTKYVTGDGKIPNGDCLEMMCQYGCVENDKGVGKCCSSAGKAWASCEVGLCCKSGICDNGKCGCETSADCLDLHTYCSNGKCVPCNQAGTGVRPNKNAEHCGCPDGFAQKCGSVYTTMNCVNGASWTCVPGCFDHTDCPTDEYCSCNGANCPASGGTCYNCPEGTHRAQDSVSECVPCSVCEQWDEKERKCVPSCGENAMCMQTPGYTFGFTGCGGDYCMALPSEDKLVRLKGTLNKRMYYLPPSGNYYKMTHTSASRFCEYYGMHLATVNEACMKDYAYDTGHDCPNIVGNQSFSDRGRSFNLSNWHVEGLGSFWLANKHGNSTALRVTYSCGNNHSTYVCESFYPLCTKD